METREIPEREWRGFFDEFSRMHRGERVDVETFGGYAGAAFNAQLLPLLGVTAEPAGGDGKGGQGSGGKASPRIEIMVGDSPSANIGHTIERPARVRVSEWNDGASASVEIEQDAGPVTRLRVGPAEEVLPPGFITDGYLPKQ